MSNLFCARSQMGLSLAFHIIFASLGIGLPVLMVLAEGLYLRTRQARYLELTRRWARGAAILFAVGAVSGTVLSFELGLLWPAFMEQSGAVIGMPFALEGFAFFTEAIFLGVYLYGWDRLPPLGHWLAGVLVAASGVLSGIFVVTANAWMNAPTGFRIVAGRLTAIDPVAAMLNPASFAEVLHMTLAALVATGFAVAAVHAFFLLRDRNVLFHRAALGIALAVGAVSLPLQVLSGDHSARTTARQQPAKLAAMEAHYRTEAGAPLIIGGLPQDDRRTTDYALVIPRGLSLLVAHDPRARVTGLEDFPRPDWPNVRVVHWSFDLMVAAGMVLLALSLASGWLWWRQRRLPQAKWLLRALVAGGPLGFVAVEAGWIVTEVGRQPWIIDHVMRTSAAVTPMPALAVPFAAFTVLYLFLAGGVVVLLVRQFLETREPLPEPPGTAPDA